MRERFLQIAQDARNSLQATVSILLNLASRVQATIDRKKYGELAALIAPFEGDDPTGGIACETPDSELRDAILDKLIRLHVKLEYKKQENADHLGGAYKVFKTETPEERRARSRDFGEYMRDREYEYRKWLFYILHRDLLDVVFDGDFYSRVRYAVLSTRYLFERGSLSWKRRGGDYPLQRQEDLFRNYAREIDENPKNLARLQKKLKGFAFALPKLLRALAPIDGDPAPIPAHAE